MNLETLNKQEAIMPTYDKNTKHFDKAEIGSYNYKFIDDAIMEAYNKGYTQKQIAVALREPKNRIAYRVKILLEENLIEPKRNTRKMRINRRIKMLERQLATLQDALADA